VWLYITTGYTGKWLQYNDENFIPTLKSPINSATDVSHGLFLRQEYKTQLPKPFNKVSISPSIRYDEMKMNSGNLNRFEHQWSPSLSAYVSMGEKYRVYLKSSISRSFRVPTFSDLFYQDVRVEGKPDLLPEKSLSKEIGLGWEVNKWGKLRCEINLYNYSIDNMIVWKLGSFEVFRPFNNDADITGQDYSLFYQLPNENLSLQFSYTHLQPLDKNNHQTTHNKIIPYRPQHSFKSNIQFGYKEFLGKINYRVVGKRFVTVANTIELPTYQVVDLSLLQSVKIGQLKTVVKLSINNLTNKLYEIIRGYPIPGREFRIGITLKH
jgi:outer membrane cobalamin receptor